MNEHIKDYFYFSRGEKNGLIVLLIIVLILFIFPFAISMFPDNKTEINKEFKKEIEQFSQSLTQSEEPEFHNRLDQYIIERYDSLKLFFFNPNITSAENFTKLGLTEKQINTINNYLEKGGKFYIKDDLRKIYGIRQQQYQILKPFILLPDNKQNNYSNIENSNNVKQKKENKDSLFVFDPNSASNEDLSRLGFTDKQINTIRNFKEKAGKFNSKEDFRKIYGITNEQFNKIEPYIFIQKQIKPEIKVEEVKIELNTATLEQLIEIKGIGQYTASEIIKYRKKLGGFVNKEQLLEIKNIKKETYDNFENSLIVDSKKITILSLNFGEIEDFSSHPYLNYYQAKEIIKYRTRNGPFKLKRELLDNKILLELTFKKIEPYFSVN